MARCSLIGHTARASVAALVAWGTPSSALAQSNPVDPPDAGARSRGAALAPPVLRSRVEAIYPPEALRERVEAAVGLEIVVDEQGNVVDAHVTAPAGHGFDDAALDAVRGFKFEPARSGDRPIRSTVQLVYPFRPPAVEPSPALGPLRRSAPVEQRGPEQVTLVVASKPVVAPSERNGASDSSTGQDELSLLPRVRAEELLDVVPGLFSVQHAGGGKAQQDFARGFNLDHGTDMAFFVDGVPINAVSHAHGQGYSDLHFLIPETVARVDSTKGPYAADVGDFGTAGSVTFRMADEIGGSALANGGTTSLAKLELAPSTGRERFVAVESPHFGDGWRMAVAAEAFHDNGPFIHPEDFDRFNAYVKATRVLDGRSELSWMAMAYGASWNMSGVLPTRAVCGEGDGTPTPAAYAGPRCIRRFDSVDPTQGGASQRVMLSTEYKRQIDPQWKLNANLYVLHSNLALFPNDGIASDVTEPDGIRYGSQIEQDDTRTQMGGGVALVHNARIEGIPIRTTFGVQVRDDDIESQLHRTQARVRLDGTDANIPGPLYDGRINETEIGIYGEEQVRPTRWLRFVLGVRGDRVDAAVNNESQTARNQTSGYAGQAQLSPKGTAVVTPVDALDLFANYGRGFHSNDARTLSSGPATTLIAAATASDIGTTVRPLEGLSVSATGFLIDLTSELTLDGDTASTTPSGRTRRYGVEVTGRYEMNERLYADVTFTAAHSRFTDAADVAGGRVYLPDAPIRTFSAALGGRQPFGPVVLMGSVTVRSMSSRYGDQGPSPLVETGWTVVDLQAGVRWRSVEIAGTLSNVANVAWREGQFEVNSRLPQEGPNPPAGISFTPGIPRTLMLQAALHW